MIRAHFLNYTQYGIVKPVALPQILLIELARDVCFVPELHIEHKELPRQLYFLQSKLDKVKIIIAAQNICA